MMKKRIIRLLENLDRSRKTQLPIKNPEAGEAYLVTKPTNKTVMDPYKWTQKGWTPIPRKDPVVLWRWGLLRHKKHAWAPPLIRIDYVHLHVNTDLMLLHYVPTKDNENMLEIRSAIVPLRTETHTLLSMGDVNFGQHSQLLTNSPLPPSHIWELLSAGGGLTQPITEPQPGGVYVTNMDSKDRLDLYSWKVLGDIRLSCNDYGLLETSALVEWGSGEVRLGRLTYHTPLIRARTVIHYMGDCRPYLDRAKNEEQERLKRLEVIAKVTNSAATLDLTHLEVSTNLGSARGDGVGRDPATEAVGSILAGLGSNIMDSDTLNQTFAELGGEVEGLCDGSPSTTSPAVTRLEDQHLQDSTLPPIQVAYGSISTTALVNQLFPEGLPKITVQKILEVEEGEVGPLRKRRTEQHLLELPEMKNDTKDEERRMLRGPYRAIPRTLQDWNEEEECDDGGDGSCEGQRKTRLEITTTESRTIVYIRQHHTLTEKQLDHFLCNPDVSRVSFLPLIDPQPGDVYVVAIPYRKGEVRRLDCHDWYVTGHKKGKFRRTYSYIKDQEGNTSHRLLRYTYDYAWEDSPGLRVVHYIPGDPRHQVLCCGKKPNYEEEPEGKGSGPLYRAYTASMTYRDVLLIMNDPPLYHVCELPIHDPKAGDVYIIKAPSLALAQRESMYDNLIWTEGQVKNVGGKRPALRKTKYLSFDPSDGTRSDAFVRVTWERLLDPSEVTAQLGGGHRRQPLVIIHYLGDETMAGEMMRRGKDGTLHLRQIQHYMETGSYLPSVHITEKNSIRKSAKKFTIENNILYYISKSQREMRRVLYTNEEKNKAFEECHIMPKTGEHCGRTKTLKRLSEKYYWTNMVEDLVAMIVRCKACEFNKLNRPNQRFVRVTEPWEVVSIDIIGQFVASSCGNNFVAVIIDMFTKYTVVVPLRDTTVSDVTSALETAVFLQGPPRKFISDQCEEFVQELSLELDMRLGVNVVAVSKTQMNRPEEANIKTSILHHCLEADADWKDQLQKKVYEINTEYMTTSGYTPFYLMFHREPRPIDGSLSLRVNSNSKPTFLVRDIEPYMEERDQRASEIINQVLTGQPATERTKVYLEEAGASAREAGDLLNGVLEEGGGSVYEMGDGEGHVVVVAGGVAGLEGGGDGGEEEGQHMVVVQPGVGDQGVIMLAENQVIMEAVAGQQFTYLPSS
ncbi:hypothetical protein O3P69_005958 [Scylla paramamosain]|uniref:RNA-directed DNA polymerase n=1 Tax=Scylla paramamosain TaxID=85552 RepID=A0AAW0U5R6_SCYPA